MSCIKSIQRGTGSGNRTITISEVDVTKTLVLINGGKTYAIGNYTSYANGSTPFAYLSSRTSLVIEGATAATYFSSGIGTSEISYAWQVIEFT